MALQATWVLALTSTTLMGCSLVDPVEVTPGLKGAFCADEDNFQADTVIEALSRCDGLGSVQEQDCNSRGCLSIGVSFDGSSGGCQCATKTLCETMGGNWAEVKCKDLRNIGTLISVAEEARQAGGNNPCENKKVQYRRFNMIFGWQNSEKDLREAVGYVGRECCSDFPSTLCDSNISVTTCASLDDFKPDEDVHGECNTHLTVENTTWLAAGCSEGWGGVFGDFKCDTKSSCEQVGSFWMKTTCADWLRQQNDDFHRQLAKANADNNCTGLELEGSVLDLSYYTFKNEKCCVGDTDICDVSGVAEQYLI